MDRSNAGTLRLSNRKVRWFDDISSSMPAFYRRGVSGMCDRLGIPTLRRWLLPMPGHLGLFRLPARLSARFIKDPNPEFANIQAGDILLLPDSYWSRFASWSAIDAAKQKGATLVFLLYDLIPFTHAELYDHAEVLAFRNYLDRLVELADGVIAISATVADEFQTYLRHHHPQQEKRIPVRSFALGAEISSPDGFVRGKLRSLFGKHRKRAPYLMVGSIEVRKNHHYAMDALELAWKKDQSLSLVIVGRTGWQGKAVVERVRSHPQYNKKLFLFSDVTDAELSFCYANSRGILFPSLTEGFGLPIVEALWHGSQPFVSDISSHREVGGDSCFYCDVREPNTLTQLLLAWEERWGDSRPIIVRHQQVADWNASFRILCDKLAEIVQ